MTSNEYSLGLDADKKVNRRLKPDPCLCVRLNPPKVKTDKMYGSSLFCMGDSISLLSAEADYMRGMLNVECPYLSKSTRVHNQEISPIGIIPTLDFNTM